MTRICDNTNPGDPVREAAWLYYGARKTQAEIARTLGVSRQTIAAWLEKARRAGFVSIHLAPDILEHHQMAAKLRARFGLAAACIVPGDASPDGQRDHVARAAAAVMLQHLRHGAVVGVSSGRTVSALARHLPKSPVDDVTILQISGSSIDQEAHSPEICAASIAAAMAARCRNLHAPAYVSTAQLAQDLRVEPALARHFEMIARADILVFGIGELTRDTHIQLLPWLDHEMRDDYIAAGAAGYMMDRFLGDDGREIDGPLAARTMAPELAHISRIPLRIALCSGAAKARATRAALRAGLVTHIVIDAETACMVSRAA